MLNEEDTTIGEIGSGNNSAYPGALDTNSIPEVNSPAAGKTKARKEVVEDLTDGLIKVETELGTDPAGSLADVKTFLQTQHQTNGTHKSTHGPHVWIDAADYDTLTDAANAAIGKTLVISSSINLTLAEAAGGAVVIPATVLGVFPMAPGVINKNTATSFTCNAPVVGNPMHQWLSGFAAGEVTGLREAYPQWFGAVGDNSTNCTAALNVAYASVKSSTASACGKLILTHGVFRFTSQLVWEYAVDVIGEGRESCFLRKVGNFVGIKIMQNGQGALYEDFSVDSLAGQGDVSSGIAIYMGHRITMRRITVDRQGQHGIILREGALGSYYDIRCTINGDSGFRIEYGTGTIGDANGDGIHDNAGGFTVDNMFYNIDCLANGGTGFDAVSLVASKVVQIICQNNGGKGFWLQDGAQNSITVYAEQNTEADIRVDSSRNFVIVLNSDGVSDIDDNGTDNIIIDLVNGRTILNHVEIHDAGALTGKIAKHKDILGSGTDNGLTIFAETGLDVGICANGSASKKLTVLSTGQTVLGSVSATGLSSGGLGVDGEIKFGQALIALGGGAAPTLGTIGGSGPTIAGQNTWLKLIDSTGSPFWLPVWK